MNTASPPEALHRPCLLVIDDAWHDSDLKPFLQGAPQCARLVTTRNHQVLPLTTQYVPVDAMSQDEAAQLLQAGIETNTASEHEQETIRQLASLLGEWPLLLTLANGVLRDRVLHLHEPLVAALVYLQQALEKRGVVAFDASNAKKREEAVALTLEVSLIQLDTDERKRYEELAIFPEDVNIPLATVSRFWRATGNFDVLDTDKLCQRLANLSLLLRCDLSSRQIQSHDTIRKYLRTRVAPHLVTFNQQFLDSYTLAHWADLTQEEGYLWDFLVQHLCQAAEQQGKLLADELAGYRSIRVVGQRSRIIYRVNESIVTVYVATLGMRKDGDKKDVYALAKKMARLAIF